MAKTASSTANGQQKFPKYHVLVSKRFVALSLLSCVLVAFAVGRTARMILLVNPQKRYLEMTSQNLTGESSSIPAMKALPDPKMKDGKVPPETLYTSKSFSTGSASTASTQSRWIVTDAGKDNCVDVPDQQCPNSASVVENNTGDGELHLPAGQHLLLDIENVNETFLNSEDKLANAMLELVDECGLTLLSYHCHKLIPMGVTCAGVLLESHVSFHTWPKEGVITLDLYTCGPNSLLPIVPLAQELFAIPRDPEGGQTPKEPVSIWAHKTRGFPEGDVQGIAAEMSDMEYFPVGQMTDYKHEVAETATMFQQVRIYDVLIPNVQTLDSYQRSLKNDGSYESQNPELFEPDRLVYLDGVLQSRRSGEAAYHETLVHPSMFAHNNPKRVAIIGGGEGASLREVLKHKTVENVTMIEIDKMMVDISREFLPTWSDCSMLAGSAQSCFDDPRVEVQYRDAFQWFIDNFPADGPPLIDPFDIIIMDALDPQLQKDFVDALYDEGPFLKSIPGALTDDGIFISQVGESPASDDPSEQLTESLNRYRLTKSLASFGFSTIRSYIDNLHSGFSWPWQFITAFKNPHTKAEWLANPSLVDLKIKTRAMVTVDGGSPFKFFDGATMQTFHYPSKSIEQIYCLDHLESTQCSEGHGFDLNRESLPISSTLEVRESSTADRGVFAKVDIPSETYVGLEKDIPFVEVHPHAYDVISKIETLVDGGVSSLSSYINEYGETSYHAGKGSVIVDTTIKSLTSHTCNGDKNFGYKLPDSQANASVEQISREIIETSNEPGMIYSPAGDRQVKFYARATPLRDIKQGEELCE